VSTIDHLSAEDRLCLLLAQGSIDAGARARALDLLEGPLDWTLLLDRSDTHGVGPLVFRNLRALDFAGVPEMARRDFEARARGAALRNELLMDALSAVLGQLHAAGVPAIPLKGPALADTLYGDPALRECGDLDLLVPPGRLRQAWALLLANGWAPAEAYTVDAADLGWLMESNMEYAFTKLRGRLPTVLEVHWDIAWRWQRRGRAAEDLWAHARPARLRGVPCLTLDDPWQLVYLATHAARHRWQQLKWLVDIHELASRSSMDWHEARRVANGLDLTRVVRVSLSACHALFGTAFPAAFPPVTLPPWLRLYPEAPAASDMWKDALLPARLLSGTRARLMYLARVLLRPTLAERRALQLPPALEPLYYAVRPLRLGCRWTSGVARLGLRRLAGAPS